MKTMVDVFTLEVLEAGRLVASRYNIKGPDLPKEAERLATAYPGKQILINGIDYSHLARPVSPQPQPLAPAPASIPSPRAPPQAVPQATLRESELGIHMLWESYQRASDIQAFLIERMATTTLDLTRRFADQADELQQRYHAAMTRIDHMAWEQKMIEAETATRRLSDHHRRLADDDRRARQPSLIEQVAAGCVKIIEALGNDSIDSDP